MAIFHKRTRLYATLAESLQPIAPLELRARFEVSTAPPHGGHDAQSAVGYNGDSVRPSVFNCDRIPPPPPPPPRTTTHTQDFHSHPLQTDTKWISNHPLKIMLHKNRKSDRYLHC